MKNTEALEALVKLSNIAFANTNNEKHSIEENVELTETIRKALTQSAQEWQDISTAPVPTEIISAVWVFGGRHEKPELVPPDGAWWRLLKKEGSKAQPTHWKHADIPTPPTTLMKE